MKKIVFLLYNLGVVPVLWLGFHIGALFNEKIKKGLDARRGQAGRLKTQMANVADDKKRLLFHATSVGECEQALPIIDAIKKQNPDLFIILSFFSPSGYNFLKKYPNVDLKVYLPIDCYRSARRFFKTLKPDLWIISKFDVWPNHIFAAKSLNIPIVMTAATLSPNSKRDKGVAGLMSRVIYQELDLFFPISKADKDRFAELGVPGDRLFTVGDTRFDQVFNKGQRVKEAEDLMIFKEQGGLTFIAGSTWPPDEKHLLPALITKLKQHEHLRAVIVPHELHESHIRSIEQTFDTAGITVDKYTDFEGQGGTVARVAIVDTIGMLARLYRQTDIAFVGGAFGSSIHNVMEPVVFGQPVFFGPSHYNSFEAGELLKIESAFVVKNKDEIENLLEKFISDEMFRLRAGQRAMDFIANNVGATEKIIDKLCKHYDCIPQVHTN